MIRKVLFASIITILTVFSAIAQSVDTAMVLPFENTSNKPEFNWVGESFADAISDLIRVEGLNVIPNQGRKIMQQRLRIPLASLPSVATSLKLARESKATLLISGEYSIVPAQGDTAATVTVKARIINVNEGRFLTETIDGRQFSRQPVLTDALGNLQTMQGQIAYHILYQRFGSALTYSQNDLVVMATRIPPRAFEAYIKGLLTPPGESRSNYFKNAMRLYTEASPEGTYADAALELGHMHLNLRSFPEAIESFERVVYANQQCKEKAKAENKPARCSDERFAEASFYIGLIHWQQGNFEPALAVLRPLADDLMLTSVYNTLGAIAIQASRSEKKNDARSAALLNEGLELLKKASDSAPVELNIQFNYALALFLNGDTRQASAMLSSLTARRTADGEAFYVLAKSLEALKDPSAPEKDNQARKLLTAGNKYANLEKDWVRSKSLDDIKMRVEQPARKDFVSVVLSKRASVPVSAPMNQTDNSIAEARNHFKNGNDDEAMAVLRRVLAAEPMSAESYLILGKIHLRRGDLDQAISSFKTAIFWDNRLFDAHVSLGSIYIERGDCLNAKNWAASAAEIDRENQDTIALQRQVERCSK
ncbi:MAG: tetratricopeptide repeat protein [Pyrinomonadaceae bacterium]